jgi:hypothetical protein
MVYKTNLTQMSTNPIELWRVSFGGIMKKLDVLLASIFMLISWTSLATVEIKAGPCVHLRNPTQCVNYPTGECFWDYADQRCENYNNNEDQCSLITSQWRCINSHLNCFWDHDDQRCERRY